MGALGLRRGLIENLIITPLIYSVSYFNFGRIGSLFGGLNPPKLRGYHTPLSEPNTNGERLKYNTVEMDRNVWAGIQWLADQ